MGPLGAGGEDAADGAEIAREGDVAFADGPEQLDDHGGDVVLEVAVTGVTGGDVDGAAIGGGRRAGRAGWTGRAWRQGRNGHRRRCR